MNEWVNSIFTRRINELRICQMIEWSATWLEKKLLEAGDSPDVMKVMVILKVSLLVSPCFEKNLILALLLWVLTSFLAMDSQTLMICGEEKRSPFNISKKASSQEFPDLAWVSVASCKYDNNLNNVANTLRYICLFYNKNTPQLEVIQFYSWVIRLF